MNYSESFIGGVGRILLAALFLQSGFYRLLLHDDALKEISDAGIPQPLIVYWGTIGVEMVGGLALAFGFWRKFTAAVLAIFILLTGIFFYTHFGDANDVVVLMRNNQFVHFMKNLAIAGGLLQIVAGYGGRNNTK